MSDIDPKFHTAEHILTGVFGLLFGGSIVDSRFKGNKVRCDYQVNLDIPLEEAITQVENKVNEIITEDRPVTFEEVSRDAALTRCKLHRLPENVQDVRLVKVGDDIVTPCIGEHVSHTNEIGALKINTYNLIDPQTIRLTFTLI